ncbi:MAG: WD40 repeat domain-containing protein [Spirochaetota bacterium]
MTRIFSYMGLISTLSVLFVCLLCAACTNMDYQAGATDDEGGVLSGATLIINEEAPFVYSVGVTLTHDVEGASLMRFSNDGATWSEWMACMSPCSWLLEPVNGHHHVYGQFRNGDGDLLELATDTEYICRLTAEDGSIDEKFGRDAALSADGRTAVVGVDNENGKKVYVYTLLDNGLWQQAEIEEDLVVSGDRYGYSVAISGDGLVVAVGADYSDNHSGKVYLYSKNGNDEWYRVQTIVPDVSINNARFGYSLALSSDGGLLVAGAPGETVGGKSEQGAVYIFSRQVNPDEYLQLQHIVDTVGAQNDQFGCSVDISGDGDVLAMGSFHAKVRTNPQQGKARVYTWNTGTHVYDNTCTITADDGRMYDYFGYDISLSRDGSLVAAGVPFHDINTSGDDMGAVYVFRSDENGENYVYEEKLTATEGSNGDQFGSSVAVNNDGSMLAVGTRFHDGENIVERGGVYTFTYADDTWSFTHLLTVPDAREEDRLGMAVDCDDTGARIAAGAYMDDITTTDDNRGSVYILDVP